MERLRLGFIGCGAIAEWHRRAADAAATRTDITAVVDPEVGRAERMADRTGAAVFTTVDDALTAEAADAYLVMVPHHLHEHVAIEALAAGVHVLLEKPMAPSLDACDRILAASDDADGLFLVAENAQFWPEVVAVREAIEAGTIGEVVTARAWHCFPPMGEFYEGDAPWRLSAAAAGGGVALDAGSHWLRPLRMWLGEIAEVVAVTGHPYEPMESESLCRALCRFETGVVASFDGIITPGPVYLSPLFEVVGTEGMLVIDPLGEVRLHDGTVVATGNYLQSYEHQLVAFERAVLDGTRPPADARHSLGELRAALAMYRSAESGRWETVW